MIKISVVLFVIDFIDIEAIVCFYNLKFSMNSFCKLISFLNLGSFHIRKKHSDRMIGDNIESLREYIGEFQPNTMTADELKELLSSPLNSSFSSITSNGTPNQNRQSSTSINQPNPPHSFRCGYCKFSSVNSGDVKKHQTWKHANLTSNILPIDPNDPHQQPMVSYKRKRVHSTKTTNNEEDGPVVRRLRISMPSQRPLTIDTSVPDDNDSSPKGILIESYF